MPVDGNRTLSGPPISEAVGRLRNEVAVANTGSDYEERFGSDILAVCALLDEVAGAGVVFEDERVDYVEIQIDRSTWEAIRGR